MRELIATMLLDATSAPRRHAAVAVRVLGDVLAELDVPYARLLSAGRHEVTVTPSGATVTWGTRGNVCDADDRGVLVRGELPAVATLWHHDSTRSRKKKLGDCQTACLYDSQLILARRVDGNSELISIRRDTGEVTGHAIPQKSSVRFGLARPLLFSADHNYLYLTGMDATTLEHCAHLPEGQRLQYVTATHASLYHWWSRVRSRSRTLLACGDGCTDALLTVDINDDGFRLLKLPNFVAADNVRVVSAGKYVVARDNDRLVLYEDDGTGVLRTVWIRVLRETSDERHWRLDVDVDENGHVLLANSMDSRVWVWDAAARIVFERSDVHLTCAPTCLAGGHVLFPQASNPERLLRAVDLQTGEESVCAADVTLDNLYVVYDRGPLVLVGSGNGVAQVYFFNTKKGGERG